MVVATLVSKFDNQSFPRHSSNMSAKDEQFMFQALEEAAKGIGRTAPNPPVGAVLVKRNQVIAVGHHAKAGGPHAEVVALHKAKAAAKNAILYVTLEPCAHTGKTPPCAEAVIAAGVKKVVYGFRDPNPLVHGKGVRQLKKAGLQVETGVLQAECARFYLPFHTFVTKNRPFVTLKAGMSLDGMIASAGGESQWITGAEARQHAHFLRDQVDGILVGRGTITADDPRLTTRLPGKKKGHDPIRIVLDSHLRMSPRAKILKVRSKSPTWVIATHEATRIRQRMLEEQGAEVIRCRANGMGQVDLKALLALLAERGLMHVLVEGGATVHSMFMRRQLVDRVCLYLAPKLLGGKGQPFLSELRLKGLKNAISLQDPYLEKIGQDLLLVADL